MPPLSCTTIEIDEQYVLKRIIKFAYLLIYLLVTDGNFAICNIRTLVAVVASRGVGYGMLKVHPWRND